MFENVGVKIQTFAKGCFYLSIISGSFACFLAILDAIDKMGILKNIVTNTIWDSEHTILSVALSILIPVVWIVLSMIFFWCLYGFGILIENAEKTRLAQHETVVLKE